MMVEFINGLTGTRMWVAPERETEYLAAGHIRAEGPPAAPAQPPACVPPAACTAVESTAPRQTSKKKPEAAKRGTPAGK